MEASKLKLCLVITAAVFFVGCATQQDWEPKPTFVMTGEFDGEIVMHDNSPPPEHPAWRVADTLVGTLGTVALPYLVMREGARAIQRPEVVQQPEPRIVRPEVVSPEIVEIGGND